MPELPEVETIVRQLRRSIEGSTIKSVVVSRREIVRCGAARLESGLAGRGLVSIERHGKRIICRLRPEAELVFHLGMTGRLLLDGPDTPVPRHTHLQVRFKGRRPELRFCDPRRFGGVWYIDRRSSPGGGTLAPLGPDALNIRAAILRRICRRRRQIKALLLDQGIIAGLGNIYCDEVLFSTGIHPETRAANLEDGQVRRLACSIRKTLRAAIRSGGSTLRDYADANGERGSYQNHHNVYGRRDCPCRRCGTPIAAILVASRTTHVCPGCQRCGE